MALLMKNARSDKICNVNVALDEAPAECVNVNVIC